MNYSWTFHRFLGSLLILAFISQSTSTQDFTVGGNADGASCRFPFVYNNRTYHECITLLHSDMPWCSTTYNYTKDRMWGECTLGHCNEPQWPIEVKNTKTSNTHQSTYIYRCEDGFKAKQNLTVTCTSDQEYGRWNWTEETIENAIKCKHIECAVDKLRVTNGTINSKRSYYLGDEMELTCEFGYSPSAPVCSSRSEWTYHPQCNHRGECRKEDIPASKNGQWNKAEERRYYGGDLLSYSCDHSPSLIGQSSQSIVCLSDCSWQGGMNCNVEKSRVSPVQEESEDTSVFMSGREIGIGVAGIFIGALLAALIVFIIYRSKKSSPNASITSNTDDRLEIEGMNETFQPDQPLEDVQNHFYDYPTTPATTNVYLLPSSSNSQPEPTHMLLLKDGS